MGWRDRGIEIKTPDQIAKMRVAGLLVGRTLELLRLLVVPGISTGELDAIAEENIRAGGGVPSFLGYGQPPFPATICASVNDEVVHGIPGARVLEDGDVISIDCGAIVEGWHGDAAITMAVGEVSPEVTELMRVTEESLGPGSRALDSAAGSATSPTRSSPTSGPRRRLAGRAESRPPTASSRTSPATGSAPRCTSHPTSPTSVPPAAARSSNEVWPWPWSRW
jgi:hypothetical protein